MRLALLLPAFAFALSSAQEVRIEDLISRRLSQYVGTNYTKIESTRCSADQITSLVQSISKSSNGCMDSSTYDWAGSADPTSAEATKICECHPTSAVIPKCTVYKVDYIVNMDEHYNFVTNKCAWKSEVVATTTAPPSSSSSSSNAGLIGGIVGGVVVVAIIIVFFVMRNRKKRKNDDSNYTAVALTPNTDATTNVHSKGGQQNTLGSQGTQYTTITTVNGSLGNTGTGSNGTTGSTRMETGKWDDPVIMAVRIPHDAIFFGALLSRGGFGEVYKGTYKGETVAIKQLLPERRKDLAQIDDFLGEVKLMSNLEHDRIVKFIGVAWNSLSDACVVVEFMENGDLRSVLQRWNSGEEKRVNGFDADKVKIALHISHALVYLHSLQPIVVHRDLKSKNILLDANFDAKLTDFGISRERADSTMTAAVGSSLWMAPEVMMGSRYDEKADIFSFGVVLSELDTHQLPYFHAKVTETGQKVPEAAILQQVMLGRLSVGFTDRADPELVQLGRECVNLDPKARPTAAQVLHRVHQVMRQYK